ncbi:hypothetical protein ACFVTY_08930 [Streptomyces sp. NPDC058067]|uniref:hypothetical protein n=1 Tax=Streptomyces sp. NPDC058067 TaxID=3346324 RepID=UPI0036E7BAF0
MCETPTAIAYATHSITWPELLEPEELFLPREQRDIVPLLAQGMTHPMTAAELDRPLNVVRAEGRRLLVDLGARSRGHVVKEALQFQLLTAEQVIACHR